MKKGPSYIIIVIAISIYLGGCLSVYLSIYACMNHNICACCAYYDFLMSTTNSILNTCTQGHAGVGFFKVTGLEIIDICVVNLSGLQHIEIQDIIIFISTLLIILLAKDCHFAPNAPKSHLWVSHDPKLQKKIKHFFAPNAPKRCIKVAGYLRINVMSFL